MTADDLATLRAAAPHGSDEWFTDGDWLRVKASTDNVGIIGETDSVLDAAYIVALVNAAPRLLAIEAAALAYLVCLDRPYGSGSGEMTEDDAEAALRAALDGKGSEA